MSAYMKFFTPSKKSVNDPNDGMINYPEICIDTNPRFEHKLTAHEIIILDQAAELEQVTAKRDAMLEALKKFEKLLTERTIDNDQWDRGWDAALKNVNRIFIDAGLKDAK